MNGWKRGFPPGEYYEGMVDDYELSFTPLMHWHRKRTPEEKAAYIAMRERNRAAVPFHKSHGAEG